MANKHKISKSELEIDSGFSDTSSGYLSAVDQTDFEDVRSSTSAAQSRKPQMPLVPGSYQVVSPMIKMSNIILNQAPALKPWGFNQSLDMVPQSPVVPLQLVVPSGHCTTQTLIGHQRESTNYIPILNSFLKIAPHPAHGSSKDLAPSPIRKSSSCHSHARRRRHSYNKQSQGFSSKQDVPEITTTRSHSGDPCMFSYDCGTMDSSARLPDLQEPHATSPVHSICTESYSSPFTEACSEGNYIASDDSENVPGSLSPSCSKRKRFCNTYNILNRSGLLGITMRTKELIRQNKCSQAQLQKLQVHTDLFMEAMGSRDPQVWAKLQVTLQSPSSEDLKEDMVGNSGLDVPAIDCI